MYKINLLTGYEELSVETIQPNSLRTIIEQEIALFFPLLSSNVSNELDPQITLLILITDEEFLTLVSSYPKPEYVENVSTDESEICKLCFMLDNECMLFAYVEMSETVAEWLNEEVE